jgi:hypothetical protein
MRLSALSGTVVVRQRRLRGPSKPYRCINCAQASPPVQFGVGPRRAIDPFERFCTSAIFFASSASQQAGGPGTAVRKSCWAALETSSSSDARFTLQRPGSSASMKRTRHHWLSLMLLCHGRFDDLYNPVYDHAVLVDACERVTGTKGARSAGVDGQTAREVNVGRGVEGFLGDLRDDSKTPSF